MFKVVAFTAVFAIARASNLAAPLGAEWAAPWAVPVVKAYAAPVLETTVLEHHHRPQYAYSYGVQDTLTGDFKEQHETRDGDLVRGSYSLLEADGSKRIVDYHADALSGFNAVVRKEAPIVKVAAPLVAKVAEPVLPVANEHIFQAHAPVITKLAQPIVTKTETLTKIASPILPQIAKISAPLISQYAAPIAKWSAPLISQYAAPILPHAAPLLPHAAKLSAPWVTEYAAPILPQFAKLSAPLLSQYAAHIPVLPQATFFNNIPAQPWNADAILAQEPLLRKTPAYLPQAQLAANNGPPALNNLAPKTALPPSREPIRFSSPLATIETPAEYQLKQSRPSQQARSQQEAQNPLPNLDLPLDASLANLGLEENQWAAQALKQW